MNTAVQKPKDPNWVCTFSIIRNKAKTEKKHPDLVLVDSEKKNKEGKPFKKNFTINGVWHEASGYIQEDKSIKINIINAIFICKSFKLPPLLFGNR